MQARALPFLPLASLLGCWLAAAAPAAPQETAASECCAPTPLWIHAESVIVRPGLVRKDCAVLIEGGRIRAMGEGLACPPGARAIEGKVVCAAFIDPWSDVCLDGGSAIDDDTSPSTLSSDALVYAEDEHLCREALRAGVSVVRVQAGGVALLGGKSAALRLAPELPERLLCGEAALGSAIGVERRGRDYDVFDRLSQVDKLLDQLESGRKYNEDWTEYRYELAEWEKAIADKEKELEKDAKKAKKDREKEQTEAKEKGKEFKEKSYKEDKRPRAPKLDPDREAMGAVSAGLLPLFVQADGVAEIRALLDATKGFARLRLVLVGGAEAEPFAAELVERHIPVLLAPLPLSARTVGDADGASLSLAAKLSKAGVEVLLGSGAGDAGTRDLPLLAALAVGHGLDRDQALHALTLGAARSLDLADRIGSVEVGKEAELLVLDGDPLAALTQVRFVISAGNVVVQPEN